MHLSAPYRSETNLLDFVFSIEEVKLIIIVTPLFKKGEVRGVSM